MDSRDRGIRRLGALLLGALAALLIAAPPAAAEPTRDGWGFAIADDDWEWDNPGYLPSLEGGFAELRPKAFRFQMIWNAVDLPWHMDRARAMIARARAQGVEQIVVTFKKSVGTDVDPVYGSKPTAAGYAEHVGEAVRQLAGDVDVWGPANEPNLGEMWLPGVSGAQLLAGYYGALEEAVETWDPTAEITSPDFVDRSDLGTIGRYVRPYENAGGGWGDHVAWHPYAGTYNETTQTTLDLIGLAPAGADVWVTEVGAFARDQRDIEATESYQNDKVWWIGTTLAALPQVERIHYYHMRGNPGASWDTGLMSVDASPRPAWHTWCALARGVADPACQPVTPRTTPLPPEPPEPPEPPLPPDPLPPTDPSPTYPLPPPPTTETSMIPAVADCPFPTAPDGGCHPPAAAPPADGTAPRVAIGRLPAELAFAAFADGIALRVRTSEPSSVTVELAIRRSRTAGGRGRFATVARRSVATAGAASRTVRLSPRWRPLRRARPLVARVTARATDGAGNAGVTVRRMRVTAPSVAAPSPDR